MLLVYFGVACADEAGTVSDPAATGDWTLVPDPMTEIGREGDPHSEFYEIVGVAVTSDGRLVVADRGSQSVRVYSPSGGFLREWGDEGVGPGEFRFMTGLAVRGDSILVTEGMFGPPRFHVFDQDAGLLRTMPLGPDTPSGVTPRTIVSASVLVVVRGAGPRETTPPPDGEVVRDSVILGVLRIGESQAVTWIGQFPNLSWFSHRMPPGLPVKRGVSKYRLGASLLVAASGDEIWIGDSGTGVIAVFDSSGARIAQFEVPVPPRQFDAAAIVEARETEVAAISDPDRFGLRARIEALYSSSMLPSTVPRFTRLTPGPGGKMWVELFTEVPGAEHRAVVLDSTGREIGRATIPSGLTVLAVGRDLVVGVRKDTLGVERLVVHRLVR